MLQGFRCFLKCCKVHVAKILKFFATFGFQMLQKKKPMGQTPDDLGTVRARLVTARARLAIRKSCISSFRPIYKGNPFIKHFIEEILCKVFVNQYFFPKTKSCEIFLLEKFPIYFFQNIPKDVFQLLLGGPKTMRKKY